MSSEDAFIEAKNVFREEKKKGNVRILRRASVTKASAITLTPVDPENQEDVNFILWVGDTHMDETIRRTLCSIGPSTEYADGAFEFKELSDLKQEGIRSLYIKLRGDQSVRWLQRALVERDTTMLVVVLYSKYKGLEQKFISQTKPDLIVRKDQLNRVLKSDDFFRELLAASNPIEEAMTMCTARWKHSPCMAFFGERRK